MIFSVTMVKIFCVEINNSDVVFFRVSRMFCLRYSLLHFDKVVFITCFVIFQDILSWNGFMSGKKFIILLYS